jgi:hypothetical protein
MRDCCYAWDGVSDSKWMVVPEKEGAQRVVEGVKGKEMRVAPEVISIRDKEVPEIKEKFF